ncbi:MULTISPECIES: hypothetical protein [Chryseobacterium]|uniref:Uncharacterized protein n=1 Tax=Chryseobacterium taihuense TaxID=1141221 RepID=A0A4U8WHA7_9FLAO|nr:MULTISPECIES: hypothetical protein [Chryseobacterium]QQV01625.1 hypothetical protein I6I61_11020 [Chryseobacterium sp. FDAARGOS 1104]VFB05176.1 Uncharacterised protein [Chryseobacterium taihuense]
MGLKDFIFGKPTKIENEFFGTMLFLKDKKDKFKSYFECRRQFIPSNKIIEICINGNLNDSVQKQIDFFKSIEDNYSVITKVISPLIEDEFGNWKEDFKINDFQKEFEPVYLRLPRCENKPIVWEIAFESYHDRNHTFTLTMSDFNAKEILIDG